MRPRWLLNENFPQPSVQRLRAAGWDVLAVAESAISAADPAVMALAREEGRCLVTFDRDYGELVFRQRFAPPPLVLLLRVRSYRPDEPSEWIESLYDAGISSKDIFTSSMGTQFGGDPCRSYFLSKSQADS